MLKEADPQVVEGVSGQWGLGRGRTLGRSAVGTKNLSYKTKTPW